MAYPTVIGPYGFKPINLLGGQVFAGSTRQLPIQYGYATNIFNGDLVAINRGTIVRAAVTTTVAATVIPSGTLLGVFLGCSYTDPVTKRKEFSQYYPASTLAGDIMAYITDDPDVVMQCSVVTANGGTTIGSASTAIIGYNLAGSDLAGSINTGNSSNGVVAPAATPTSGPFRIVDVVRDSAIAITATGSSGTTTITLTGTGLPSAIPVGTDVSYIAANGQIIQTGSFVTAAAAAAATSVTINAAIAVPGSVTSIPAASTIVFTQYPEVKVKFDFGFHAYYAA